MPVAVWCILLAAFLPMAAVLPAKMNKGFDNARPRDPAYWADGFRARAQWAQENGFEAFPLFAISVIVGLGQGGDAGWIDRLAVLFVALRVVYTACYWLDRATPRSLAWLAATATSLAIFTSPVWS
ncbi:MAPEG family protein [Polymorphum gilvum]|uniref:Membrane protein n=1 Tax=Polymorphum gilvum (strain LMG 25793 / CGMCC 1.9160 / SL003B-26A1) TaxID=991905 RepID=F2IVE2_POLGS|nr:MAPEG family protein [Polymorphum gilvum]ADZ72660.1 Membrane protein [Polymorphum gilvum SL003B-26A1]